MLAESFITEELPYKHWMLQVLRDGNWIDEKTTRKGRYRIPVHMTNAVIYDLLQRARLRSLQSNNDFLREMGVLLG